MPNPTFSKPILIPAILIILALAGSIFVYAYIQTKETNFTQPPNPVSTNQALKPTETIKPTEPEPTEPAKLETYKSELFIQAKWGKGRGEVGMLYNPDEIGKEGDIGPNYGPQSFDIDEATGHLFLMDSINERMIEYDENGKYLRDFPIGIGATTDMKIKDNHIYVLSFGSDAVYKLDTSGKILEIYLIASEKNPGIGNLGIEFDENGNIMVETSIKGYNNNDYRFYQASPNGDKWKTNSYKGNISRDKKGFYFARGSDWYTSKIQKVDEKGNVQKEFTVKLKEKAYVYYEGFDDKDNVYLNIGYKDPIKTEEGSSDEFIWKYSKDGKLLAEIDLFSPFRKFFKDDELLAIPRIYSYARQFKGDRITSDGDIYYMFNFKGNGIMIFKYSKIK